VQNKKMNFFDEKGLINNFFALFCVFLHFLGAKKKRTEPGKRSKAFPGLVVS